MNTSIGIGKSNMSNSMSLSVCIEKKELKALLYLDMFKGRSDINCIDKKSGY